jgi:hypothetical protein
MARGLELSRPRDVQTPAADQGMAYRESGGLNVNRGVDIATRINIVSSDPSGMQALCDAPGPTTGAGSVAAPRTSSLRSRLGRDSVRTPDEGQVESPRRIRQLRAAQITPQACRSVMPKPSDPESVCALPGPVEGLKVCASLTKSRRWSSHGARQFRCSSVPGPGGSLVLATEGLLCGTKSREL